MARPLGSKNKTPQELKTEADILRRKAETKLLEQKLKKLQQDRRK